MIRVLKYISGEYRRRIVFDDTRIISAIHLYNNKYNVGDLYLGKVISKASNGYFINTSDFNCYTNDKNLNIGENYVFEIVKIIDGKKPLVTSKYTIQSNSLILSDKKGYSKNIDKESIQKLGELEINAFFKTESISYSNKELLSEYAELIKIKEHIEKKALYEKSLIKLYSVPFEEIKDDYIIREFEEKIKDYSKSEIIYDRFRLNIEKTKVGLIIDVDSMSSKESIESVNLKASKKIAEILITMNVSGIVIVDFIQSGEGADNSLLLSDKRITYSRISKNGICEIIRKSVGINLLK